VLSRLGETSISKIEEYRTAIQSFVTILKNQSRTEHIHKLEEKRKRKIEE